MKALWPSFNIVSVHAQFPDSSDSWDTVKPKKKVDIPQSLPAVGIDVIKKRITGR